MIISLNDVLICTGIVPFVEALFAPNRQSMIFGVDVVCGVWFVYWWIVSNLSIILIALLSVTRLCLLRSPNKSIPPWIAYLVPSVLVFLYLLVIAVAVPSGVLFTVYVPDLLQCTFTSWPPTNFTTTHSFNTSDGAVFLILMLLFNSLTTNVFLMVSVSFVLSLIHLKRSRDLACKLGCSASRPREAAKTVILVTLTYIVFNVPGMLVAIFLALNILVLSPATFRDVTSLEVEYFGHHPIANQYLLPVTGCVCVCLNSAFNPIIYFFRIKSFRRHTEAQFIRLLEKAKQGGALGRLLFPTRRIEAAYQDEECS